MKSFVILMLIISSAYAQSTFEYNGLSLPLTLSLKDGAAVVFETKNMQAPETSTVDINQAKVCHAGKCVVPHLYSKGKDSTGVIIYDEQNALGLSDYRSKDVKTWDVYQYPATLNRLELARSYNAETAFFIFGAAKLGTFVGVVPPAGESGKDKYKIIPNVPYGALALYVNGTAFAPIPVSASYISKNAAIYKLSTKTKPVFVLNDNKLTDNKGGYVILTQDSSVSKKKAKGQDKNKKKKKKKSFLGIKL